MKNILALETSSNACSAALMCGNEIVEKFTIAPQQHAALILSMLKELCAEAGLSFLNCDAIAFGCGPGSFTGLRIAASTVQGIAFAVDMPVISVSSLRAIAQAAFEDTKINNILVAIDAHMDEIYWGIYQLGENNLMHAQTGDCLCKPENAIIPEKPNWLAVGGAWRQYEKALWQRLKNKLLKLDKERYPRAREVVKIAKDKLRNNEILPAEQALPVYLRGEQAWKK